MKRRFLFFLLICVALSSSLFLYLHFRVAPGLILNEIELLDEKGNKQFASNLKGDKGVILHFFATWCPDCRAELPELINATSYLKEQGFTVYAITDERLANIEPFLNLYKPFGLDFLQLKGKFKQFSINAIPTTFIYDASKKLIYSKVGRVKWDDMEWLDKVLK